MRMKDLNTQIKLSFQLEVKDSEEAEASTTWSLLRRKQKCAKAKAEQVSFEPASFRLNNQSANFISTSESVSLASTSQSVSQSISQSVSVAQLLSASLYLLVVQSWLAIPVWLVSQWGLSLCCSPRAKGTAAVASNKRSFFRAGQSLSQCISWYLCLSFYFCIAGYQGQCCWQLSRPGAGQSVH